MQMKFYIESNRVYLHGKIGRDDLAELIPIFIDYIRNQEDSVIFDLSRVDTMDTMALQMLIATKRSANQARKKFKLLNINQELKEIFSTSGIDAIFENSIDKT
jgi:anti-anti-sigma factor